MDTLDSADTVPESERPLSHGRKFKRPFFDTVFVTAVGGAALGGYFGMLGLAIGALVGGSIGAYVSLRSDD